MTRPSPSPMTATTGCTTTCTPVTRPGRCDSRNSCGAATSASTPPNAISKRRSAASSSVASAAMVATSASTPTPRCRASSGPVEGEGTLAYDLVITGGVVIDGTGLARRRADVGVKDGTIVEVGHLTESTNGAHVIDADGLMVAPGIIDAHTHYDPQLTFDGYATSSCYHGVTTVLAGNCGFSIAPTRADDRDYITRMFAKVEGMSPATLSGVDWDFESFPDYLARRQGRLGVNLACYVGHS